VTSHRQTVVLGLIARWRPGQCYGPSAETYSSTRQTSIFELEMSRDQVSLPLPRKAKKCCSNATGLDFFLGTFFNVNFFFLKRYAIFHIDLAE
jgi:hypothetical protein